RLSSLPLGIASLPQGSGELPRGTGAALVAGFFGGVGAARCLGVTRLGRRIGARLGVQRPTGVAALQRARGVGRRTQAGGAHPPGVVRGEPLGLARGTERAAAAHGGTARHAGPLRTRRPGGRRIPVGLAVPRVGTAARRRGRRTSDDENREEARDEEWSGAAE